MKNKIPCNILGCRNEATTETQHLFKKKWFMWVRVCDDHIKDFVKLVK